MHDTAPVAEATSFLAKFAEAIGKPDSAAVLALFAEDCYWRDLVAFSWNVKTFEGKAEIAAMLGATLGHVRPSGWTVTKAERMANGGTEAWFGFETALGRGTGIMRLEGGLCRTILTTLQELKGFEEPLGAKRPMGVRHGANRGRETWSEKRARETAALGVTEQPYCLIIGGGQGGIMLAARLKQLGVPTIIIEKNLKPGDSWRKRYRSLVLHDPVWYDHLPYLPFPANWPVFTPKDKMATGWKPM